jgi:folate-binding protein YgfZ
MVTRLPLHDSHRAAGAVFGAPCGIELPMTYGDPAAEYAAVRQGVGLIDRSDADVLEVTGRDRATFLHAMLSNDIKGLAAGRGGGAALLDVHGKVQALMTVWALEDRLLLVLPAGLAVKTTEALDHYMFSEKATFRDATSEWSLLMLAGPQAAALVRRLTGVEPPTATWSHSLATLAGVEVRLVRGAGETGEAEVWVVSTVAQGPGVWTALLAGGARPVGLTASESLRLETGTPRWGHDVDATVLLPEIPLEGLVSYTKGCYLGQEVVVRIRDRGHVNRHLRGLVVEGEHVPAPGDAVLAGDSEIGRVTSAAPSFGLKRPLALGFVRRQHGEPGTRVTIRSVGGPLAATVTTLPVPR